MLGSVVWKNAMAFDGKVEGYSIPLDAKSPIGKGQGATPKELVLVGIAGCTAMDVVALMKKHKQNLTGLEVTAEAEPTTGHPVKFQSVRVVFKVTGEVDAAKLTEAVILSQTKYCGVTAMIVASAPVYYDIELNGQKIGQGEAKF